MDEVEQVGDWTTTRKSLMVQGAKNKLTYDHECSWAEAVWILLVSDKIELFRLSGFQEDDVSIKAIWSHVEANQSIYAK